MMMALVMRTTAAALAAAALTACSGPAENQSAAAAGKRPFFRIDAEKRGPLTIEELQVDPDNSLALPAARRDCYIAKIGELAAAAGDPEKADAVALGYVTDGKNWRKLKRDGRRLILAQAIVSRAITFCPETTKVGG